MEAWRHVQLTDTNRLRTYLSFCLSRYSYLVFRVQILIENIEGCSIKNVHVLVDNIERPTSCRSGSDSEEVTPVLMPNTEVKFFSADGSWGLPPARVGRCQAYFFIWIKSIFHSSSVVELSAVNRSVVGSNPTCGANCFHSSVGRAPPW